MDRDGAGFDLTLPILIGIGLILVVWLFNIYGVRPAVWFGYVTGALLCIPVFVLMFLPYVTGDWSSSNMQWQIGANGGLALALTWLYFMCWSSYGIEVVATFAPEYKDTERDTTKALRAAAMFSVLVYALLPLGLGGTLGTEAVAADATIIAFYTQAFDLIVGNALANVMIFCVVAGLVLSMNTATMDGSRALYGIAHDGMTIRQFGRLNRFHVPALAMTVDRVLNVLLISFFNNPIEIIAVSNIGYVFATCAALAGFLLLRKDRPQWPRPVHLSTHLGAALRRAADAEHDLPRVRRLRLLRRLPRHRGLRLRLGQDPLGPVGPAARPRAVHHPARGPGQAADPLARADPGDARGGARAPRLAPRRRPARRSDRSLPGPARQSARRSQRGRSAIAAR